MPTKLVPVIDLFATPGPFSVKLWMFDLSLTMTMYLPRLSVGTFPPCPFLSEIVKPGPTVPCSVGAALAVATAPVAIPTVTNAAEDARATMRKRMSRLLPSHLALFSIGCHWPPRRTSNGFYATAVLFRLDQRAP